ncbi:MAG TPA: DUF6428 family protein [Lacunisphaera sp.]
MKTHLSLSQLRAVLRNHPATTVAVALPDGRPIPAQFHVTEAGTVTKDFLDCGGTRRQQVTAQLQIWTGRDAAHRLSAARLDGILDACSPVLPAGDAAVDIEYEDTMVSRYPVVSAEADGGELWLQLGRYHTDCLARASCGMDEPVASEAAACGCGSSCC